MARAGAGNGTPATGSAAPSVSWNRWNVRSCQATDGCARSDLRAAKLGQVGENWVRRKDGRMERLQGCDETTYRCKRGHYHSNAHGTGDMTTPNER